MARLHLRSVLLFFLYVVASSLCRAANNIAEDVLAMLQGRSHLFTPDVLVDGQGASRKLEAKLKLDVLTKREMEIVLSHHDENASWSDPYARIRTIYCKGRPHPGCIPLKNVGREGFTYLHHIVTRYDDLAQWTVFSHAQEPTIGYSHQIGGHMMPGYSFDEYVASGIESAGGSYTRRSGSIENDGAGFIFTGALDVAKFDHYMRKQYVRPFRLPQFPSRCPSQALGDGWVSWPFGNFAVRLAAKCNTTVSRLPSRFDEYWSNLDMEKPPVLFFAQGARFAVSRERIHQRPKKFYEKMLRFVSGHPDPCENYFNEWMWYYMIGRPTSHCNWVAETA